jgi:glycosyltransferase involved in cell wall biosynthesis
MSVAGPGTAPLPFHATPTTDPPPARRILLVSYVFPPNGSVGGLRWQKMSRFAVERGWGVDVVCLAPEDVAVPDAGRLRDLPPNVRVFGVREPPAPVVVRAVHALWRAVARRHRGRAAGASEGSAGRPSAPARPRVGSIAREEIEHIGGVQRARRTYTSFVNQIAMAAWARDAAATALRLVEPAHQVVVASGPPHRAVHDAGRLIAARTGLPYVMDMRDPWSLVKRVAEQFATPYYFRVSAEGERQAVERAALIVANTEAAADALRRLYPAHAARTITVMNGSDDDPLPSTPRDPRFVMAYAGNIYWDRDPRPLFRAAARVVRELALTPDRFAIRFMGVVGEYDGVTLEQIADEEGIGEYVSVSPPGPRAEALRLLASASMLVSLPQDSVLALPSKIFEYSRFDAWLLALADPGSATATLLRDTTADVISSDDVDAMADAIRRRYLEHAAGVVPRAVDAEGRFSRERQATLLLDRLDDLAGRRAAAAPAPAGR